MEQEIAWMEKEQARKQMMHEQQIEAIDRETMAKIAQVREKSHKKVVHVQLNDSGSLGLQLRQILGGDGLPQDRLD